MSNQLLVPIILTIGLIGYWSSFTSESASTSKSSINKDEQNEDEKTQGSLRLLGRYHNDRRGINLGSVMHSLIHLLGTSSIIKANQLLVIRESSIQCSSCDVPAIQATLQDLIRDMIAETHQHREGEDIIQALAYVLGRKLGLPASLLMPHENDTTKQNIKSGMIKSLVINTNQQQVSPLVAQQLTEFLLEHRQNAQLLLLSQDEKQSLQQFLTRSKQTNQVESLYHILRTVQLLPPNDLKYFNEDLKSIANDYSNSSESFDYQTALDAFCPPSSLEPNPHDRREQCSLLATTVLNKI